MESAADLDLVRYIQWVMESVTKIVLSVFVRRCQILLTFKESNLL
jgi:hypothetical protein